MSALIVAAVETAVIPYTEADRVHAARAWRALVAKCAAEEAVAAFTKKCHPEWSRTRCEREARAICA